MAKPESPPGKPDKPDKPPPEEILPPEPPASGDVSVELPMAKATAYQGELGASTGSADPTPTYYVDATGGLDSNNGTSSATPWQTLAKVMASAGSFVAGDIIALRCGRTWNEQLSLISLAGGSGNPITFTSYSTGAKPIIDGQHTRDWCVYVEASSNLVFSNLHVINADADGAYCLGNVTNVTFNDLLAEFNGRGGFNLEATPGVTDQDNITYNRCVANENFQTGFVAYNVSPDTTGIHYYNCLSTYSGQGVAAHGFSGYFVSNIHFHQCEAAFTNIDPATDAPNAFTSEGVGFAFDDFCHNSSIEHSFAHHNQGPGITLGHQSDNNIASYNVVSHNLGGGIVINGNSAGSDNILVYNNTIAHNTGHGLEVQQPAVGTVVKNNILANNTGFAIAFSSSGVTGYTVATNIIYSNGGTTSNVTGATGTITSDPLFTAPGSDDYTLQGGSPALGAGLDLGSTYQTGLAAGTAWPLTVNTTSQGGTYDLGAFIG